MSQRFNQPNGTGGEPPKISSVLRAVTDMLGQCGTVLAKLVEEQHPAVRKKRDVRRALNQIPSLVRDLKEIAERLEEMEDDE